MPFGVEPPVSGRDESTSSAGAAGQVTLQWMLLGGLTSALLATVTGVIAVQMGSFPLIWIIPLAVYLISFAVTFRDHSRIAGKLGRLWPEAILIGLLLYLIPPGHYALQLGHLVAFAVVCILVHAALYAGRPHPRHLPAFYMAIAAGGFIGSMAVSMIAPLVFSGLWEYPLLLLGAGVVFFRKYDMPALALGRIYRWAPMAGLLAMTLVVAVLSAKESVSESHRNYYGITRVVEYDAPAGIPGRIRLLVHDATIHGMEYTDPARQGMPTLYYRHEGGLGDVFAAVPSPSAIAAVGMGAGTVAAYTRPGDLLHFYEIDGDLEALAQKWFSFLRQGRAQTAVIVGDGRISLRKGADRGIKYDLIFVDAFSGEGIPTHLLTTEAISVYERRLKEGGVLLFHLTNRYYDLLTIVKATALGLGLHGAMKATEEPTGDPGNPLRTQYAILARSRDDLAPYLARNWKAMKEGDGLPDSRVWTDDYVNILVPLSARLRGR